MNDERAEFLGSVEAILARYRRQVNAPDSSETEMRSIAEKIWALLEARRLPPALSDGELGTPGEMTAAEVAPLLAEVLGADATRSDWLEPVRQLVKACFHPEFAVCRDSYRERSADGTCRRQVLAKARSRISGSHCVDCPYWTSRTEAQHAALLAVAWCGDAKEFEQHRAIFLPEDFRVLRRCVRALASPDKR